jgi:hypothetical protein
MRDLTQKQIDDLVDAMPKSRFFNFWEEECLIGFHGDIAGTWTFEENFKIVTYKEIMKLLGKEMKMKEFTKEDLKDGMIVKQRDGGYAIVLGDSIAEYRAFLRLSSYEGNLNHSSMSEYDITAVYTADKTKPAALSTYLKGIALTKIWERVEQTPAQKEMEELQLQIAKLQEQAKALQSKL